MRYRVCVVLLASLTICAVFYVGADPEPRSAAAAEQKKPDELPPLVINKKAPLLLDEPPEEDPLEVAFGPVADNLACHCCHTDYEEEWLALEHAKANVGCMKCHGDSLPHRDDEDNATPPDVMFARDKIDAACKKCHDDHDVPAAKVIARWQKRRLGKTDPDKVVCTDCHGQHRLKERVVRWDKNTGKLLDAKKDCEKKPMTEK